MDNRTFVPNGSALLATVSRTRSASIPCPGHSSYYTLNLMSTTESSSQPMTIAPVTHRSLQQDIPTVTPTWWNGEAEYCLLINEIIAKIIIQIHRTSDRIFLVESS